MKYLNFTSDLKITAISESLRSQNHWKITNHMSTKRLSPATHLNGAVRKEHHRSRRANFCIQRRRQTYKQLRPARGKVPSRREVHNTRRLPYPREPHRRGGSRRGQGSGNPASSRLMVNSRRTGRCCRRADVSPTVRAPPWVALRPGGVKLESPWRGALASTRDRHAYADAAAAAAATLG